MIPLGFCGSSHFNLTKESATRTRVTFKGALGTPSSVMMTTDAEGPSPAGLNAWMEIVYSVNVFNP